MPAPSRGGSARRTGGCSSTDPGSAASNGPSCAPDLESRGLVCGARGRAYGLPPPQRWSRPRPDNGVAQGLRSLATVQRRSHPPFRRPARRDVRGDPCGRGRNRRLASVLSCLARRAVHGSLPPDLGWARNRGRRVAGRPSGFKPLSPTAQLPVLATCALPEFRRLDRRDPPRPRKRHRPQLAMAADNIRGRGLCRLSSCRLADRAKAHRHPNRLTRQPRRSGRGGSRRRHRTRAAAVQAEPVERRPLYRDAHRSRRPNERHNPRHCRWPARVKDISAFSFGPIS